MGGINFCDMSLNLKKYQQMQKTKMAQGGVQQQQAGAQISSADMNSSIFSTNQATVSSANKGSSAQRIGNPQNPFANLNKM